jgi:hypothetical protein
MSLGRFHLLILSVFLAPELAAILTKTDSKTWMGFPATTDSKTWIGFPIDNSSRIHHQHLCGLFRLLVSSVLLASNLETHAPFLQG